jgi:hypothetical protein
MVRRLLPNMGSGVRSRTVTIDENRIGSRTYFDLDFEYRSTLGGGDQCIR